MIYRVNLLMRCDKDSLVDSRVAAMLVGIYG